MKVCNKCEIHKPIEDFYKSKPTRCKDCIKQNTLSHYHKNNVDNRARRRERWKRDALKHKDRRLKSNYGISLQDKEQMLRDQNNRCGICNKKVTYTEAHVDHCHTTNNVRALLCSNCNMGLGKFKDNKEFLNSALLYLEVYGNSDEK